MSFFLILGWLVVVFTIIAVLLVLLDAFLNRKTKRIKTNIAAILKRRK